MESTRLEVDSRPAYETPRITVLDPTEVLTVFQMTAAEISAAGCWWTNGSWT
jgi:hypothetical protein